MATCSASFSYLFLSIYLVENVSSLISWFLQKELKVIRSLCTINRNLTSQQVNSQIFPSGLDGDPNKIRINIELINTSEEMLMLPSVRWVCVWQHCPPITEGKAMPIFLIPTEKVANTICCSFISHGGWQYIQSKVEIDAIFLNPSKYAEHILCLPELANKRISGGRFVLLNCSWLVG